MERHVLSKAERIKKIYEKLVERLLWNETEDIKSQQRRITKYYSENYGYSSGGAV